MNQEEAAIRELEGRNAEFLTIPDHAFGASGVTL
jgi:hypothetical protein